VKTQEDQRQEEWDRYEKQQAQEKAENRAFGEYWDEMPTYNADPVVDRGLSYFYSKLYSAARNKPIKDQIDDLELAVVLGGNFGDLWKLFDIEPKEAGPERTEWLEFVAGQARKYALEVAMKTREKLEHERYLRKLEKEKTNTALANTSAKQDAGSDL
jgi:hypothetical protein